MGEYEQTLAEDQILVNTYLYGIVMVQYASYANTKYGDRLWTKALVTLLFCVDTFHSAVAIEAAWQFCVTNYTNPGILGSSFWSVTITPLCTAVSGLAGHLFLGHRAFRLTENKIIYSVILVLAFGSFGLGIASGIWGFQKSVPFVQSSSGPSLQTSLVAFWLSVQTLTNIVIAGSLSFMLSQFSPPFRNTDKIITRILRAILQTGLLAAFLSCCILITFFAAPKINFFALLVLPCGRIYSNAILDTLLSRTTTSGHVTEISLNQPKPNSIWVPPSLDRVRHKSFSLNNIQIKTEIYSDAPHRDDQDQDQDQTSNEGCSVVGAIAV
ncbi:hypothetical protein BDN72DRAFT_917105 [Pluteus cervinus]|uniref:Uncharacterized protein n=1 Tax=Pluteus cervinus TaxID=181527 RepID=A0ACD3AP15_9AGAR|nr:hypothetical protein BDN72DRAFT_917105 [Pluteus cervinus]